MTAYLNSYGKTMYLDLPIDSPMAQIQGWWFGQPVIYGEFGKERIVLVIKGRMAAAKEQGARLISLEHKEKSGDTYSADMPRPVDWEGLKRSLRPKA
jgi:hypothetical protein